MTQPLTDPPAPPADPPPPPTPPADPPQPPDDPLGPAGINALREEREARKALEQRLAKLEPLEKLAAALGAGDPANQGKTDADLLNERFAQHERALAEERAARYRAEVAAEKKLTPEQAARLVGGTRDELAADADALLALFPAAAPGAPRVPQPDQTQGSRNAPPPDLDTQIAAAQKAGDVRTVIALQRKKLTTTT